MSGRVRISTFSGALKITGWEFGNLFDRGQYRRHESDGLFCFTQSSWSVRLTSWRRLFEEGQCRYFIDWMNETFWMVPSYYERVGGWSGGWVWGLGLGARYGYWEGDFEEPSLFAISSCTQTALVQHAIYNYQQLRPLTDKNCLIPWGIIMVQWATLKPELPWAFHVHTRLCVWTTRSVL